MLQNLSVLSSDSRNILQVTPSQYKLPLLQLKIYLQTEF
jgi:hypothetical protein